MQSLTTFQTGIRLLGKIDRRTVMEFSNTGKISARILACPPALKGNAVKHFEA